MENTDRIAPSQPRVIPPDNTHLPRPYSGLPPWYHRIWTYDGPEANSVGLYQDVIDQMNRCGARVPR